MRGILAACVAICAVGLAAPALANDPSAPDYQSDAAWAALPGQQGAAGETPEGVARSPAGDVPVFFIHPTTDYSMLFGNAQFDEGGSTGARVDVTLKLQASAFNGCCEIYAPRYRQASLRAIISHTPDSYAADDIAYGDVARAFDAFIKRIGTRAFIIAAHSQGSIHAVRLLQEKIAGTPLLKRLVAAYPVGTALPKEIERLGLPICRSAAQTGCLITWNSVLTGHDDLRRRSDALIWWEHRWQPVAGRPLVCVNPLNWELDGAAGAQANLGGIYNAGKDQPIPAPVPGVTGAACNNGLLGIRVVAGQDDHYRDLLTRQGNYHVFDYGLFYMNIRANAAERIAAYARNHP